MARTRRNRGKAKNFHSNSPAASVSAVPGPGGRRHTAVSSATATKPAASGRNTQNSKRGRSRGPNYGRRNQSIGRVTNGGRGRGRAAKKDATPLQDPTSYKDENGEVYHKGGKSICKNHTSFLS